MAREVKRSFIIPEPMNGKVKIIFTDEMPTSISKIAPDETGLNDIAAYCNDEVPGLPVIVLTFDASLDDIVHESDHAAFCLLAGMGIPVTNTDNEAHAYLIGFVVGKILKLQAKINAD